MDPEKKSFRFLLLVFSCSMTFGSYFCVDMTSVLQNEMQGTTNCSKVNHTVVADVSNISCCQDCLYVTADQFNLLYAIRSWTVALIVPFVGLFIDKVGNKVSAVLMCSLVVLGNFLFVLGSTSLVRYTVFMYPTLVIGRFILGVSEASTRIVQDRVTAFWFRNKELSLAFGITLTASRLGSVLNFLVSPTIAEKFGLSIAFSFGVSLCIVSFIGSIFVAILDTHGLKQSGHYTQIQQQRHTARLRAITTFSAEFWLIIFTIMFFYSGFVPLVANGSKYIHDMYGYDEVVSAYIMGAVFDLSIPLSPVIGILVDKFGGRWVYLIIVGIMSAPAYVVLDFTLVYPLVITMYLGICYVMAAVGMWPCMLILITNEYLGIALGLTLALQATGIGAANAIVGKILGDRNSLTESEIRHRWHLSLIPLCCLMLLSTVTGVITVCLDRSRGRKLMKSSVSKDEVTIDNGDSSNTESSETDPLLINADQESE